MPAAPAAQSLTCYHCGEDCPTAAIAVDEKRFCCEGCRMVYQLLNKNGLCEYYQLNNNPGSNQRVSVRKDKFAFLEDAHIQQQLVSFADDSQTHITLYLPQLHCSSCLYLLENLHRLDAGVISSRVNFARKEVDIVFDHRKIPLRRLAELLTGIGYEPYISLNNLNARAPRINRRMIYQLGVAGFCFANIMLLSFPEYLGLEATEKKLEGFFRWLALLLALPVFFYSARPFYKSGWDGLKHKFLNIDAPIALAIIVTFSRSLYEVLSGTGSGYFDSMSGIVFFMLVGRVLQDKTYQQLSFERDFTSYFPITVSVLKNDKETPTVLTDIKNGDTLLIHNGELVPADGILTKGEALIDYSFVTGETLPVHKEMGEMVYAGGRQTGSAIELLVIREVAQSYLTRLWNSDEFTKGKKEKNRSFVHLLSRWFTWMVFLIAATAAIYWWVADSSKVLNAVTAVLIIACPCALLLSHSFTNGNILRILGRNRFYLRGAQTIEDIAGISYIVFDKTGTLTTQQEQDIAYNGLPLSEEEEQYIGAITAQSNHPLSRALAKQLHKDVFLQVQSLREIPGKGIRGVVNGRTIAAGSKRFITGSSRNEPDASAVFVSLDGMCYGYFTIQNHYRKPVPALVRTLGKRYPLAVISGDNASERRHLQLLMNRNTTVLFHQAPEDKLRFIAQLQQRGKKVMMLGDGLNDAGALRQSDVGIAITESCNNFTPASDAIMEAGQLSKLPRFIRLCRANRQIIMASFILSIVYNIIGIYFAVQGILSPLVAAILMPASSLSILLITFGCSNLAARWLRLNA